MAAKNKTNGSSFPAWDATKIWTNLNWSNLDVASLVKAQQKNIEAINMVNKVAAEGWQAITKKQTAIWQSAVEQNRIMVHGVAAAHEPSDKLAMQAAFATSSIQAGISNARDAHEFATKTTHKTVDIVSKRLIETIEETVAMVGKVDSVSTSAEK